VQKENPTVSHVLPERVRDVLKAISDPVSGIDIVSNGMVSEIAVDGGHVSFAIEVTLERAESMEAVRLAAERAVAAITGVSKATVALTAQRDDRTASKPGSAGATEAAALDAYRMNGHKMYWHLDRVLDWQNGKRVPPIHIDVGLSKGCNIRCHYCYGVTQGNFFRKGAERYFPREGLLRYVREAGEVGVRSMALIGEAEPLLNPHVYEAIVEGKKAGVDMSMGTNGILLDTGRDGEAALENLTWIRFNISAASDYAYRRVHASKEFDTAVEKIRFCVDTKRRKNLEITVGLQMVLTPKNVDQCIPLARLGAELGVDYVVIKQCSDTVDNDIGVFDILDRYKDFTAILKEAETYSSGDYRVIVKWGKILNEGHRNYDRCVGAPFLLYSSGDGKLYSCGQWFEAREEEFRMGDLTQKGFKEIFESDRYWEVIARQVCTVDVHKECYSNCRTHNINEFLWKAKTPPAHVNFI
jgi:MoaA/NifB/PqqE/SkfB family radical SAM enzyme/metal-sulfur cluster biosynthetic enzyme